MANLLEQFFGIEFRKKQQPEQKIPTFTPEENDDGSVIVAPGGTYATYADLDGVIRNDAELISKYREMIQHPEIDSAVEDIVNEMVVSEPGTSPIKINLDQLQVSDSVKQIITQEFDTILGLLDFRTEGFDVVKRWYTDGRLYYHTLTDVKRPDLGIQEIRYIDPRKIRKVREIVRKRDADSLATIIKSENEYYVYSERGFQGQTANAPSIAAMGGGAQGLRIAKDSITYVTSGVLDKTNKMVLSHLHKALKPLNMLKSVEDAIVIYRISRAPERRVFYIDTGTLPKMKAEQYVRDIMTKFKNRVQYDSVTGEIRDDRKFMTMLEDFWLPRREGGKGTEITTLQGGQNLGELEDVKYFQRNLYRSLNVPIGRLEANQVAFNIGRSAEITRDEVKFAKFIDRLRVRFSILFLDLLRKQLLLKQITTVEDWDIFSKQITFDYVKDNYYAELKDGEIIAQRLGIVMQAEPFVGKYWSHEWVMKTLLKMTDEEINQQQQQIQEEMKDRPELFAQLFPQLMDPNSPGQPIQK